MSATAIRDEFIATLDHIEQVRTRLLPLQGRGHRLQFPDHHKLAEGLFLSAWTHWEQFLRALFTEDLATLATGTLGREVRVFRTKSAPYRLAEIMIGHPDERGWIEWSDFGKIIIRANSLLGSPNRFGGAQLHQQDITTLKRIRNAIAHKSDYAWSSFRDLVKAQPFNLTPGQMKGLTVGRFLTAHNWGPDRVLQHSIAILKSDALVLVP